MKRDPIAIATLAGVAVAVFLIAIVAIPQLAARNRTAGPAAASSPVRLLHVDAHGDHVRITYVDDLGVHSETTATLDAQVAGLRWAVVSVDGDQVDCQILVDGASEDQQAAYNAAGELLQCAYDQAHDVVSARPTR